MVVGKFYKTRDINNTGSGKYQFRVMRVKKVSNLEDYNAAQLEDAHFPNIR